MVAGATIGEALAPFDPFDPLALLAPPPLPLPFFPLPLLLGLALSGLPLSPPAEVGIGDGAMAAGAGVGAFFSASSKALHDGWKRYVMGGGWCVVVRKMVPSLARRVVMRYGALWCGTV